MVNGGLSLQTMPTDTIKFVAPKEEEKQMIVGKMKLRPTDAVIPK